jgi:replicative DNA helicase
MSAGIAKIMDEGVGQSHDIDLSKNPMSRFDEYEAVKTRPNGLIGMATGFSLIDQATAGLQPGQIIVIIAPPKTGKSVIALQTAVNLHEDGFVPMFQSFEMSSREQQTRHDAMRANISHARLTRGALKTDEEVRYAKSLKRMETMHNFYLTDGVASGTLSGLQAKIEKLQPDVIFVDGVYLMTDEVTGELGISFLALTNITRGLKRLAQKVQKPIVVTTQVLESKMKGGRVSASSIGYSSSFFQDADVILALERQDAEDDSSRLFRIEASRNCGKVEVELLWDWENGKFQEY